MKCFEEHCRENYGRIYKYIFAMTGAKESTEDLIQDVFTVALEKGEAFLKHENPTAFLYRTARNLTLTYLKRQQRYKTDCLDETVSAGDGDVCVQLMRERDRQIDETVYAGRVIGSLDDTQRELYKTRYIDGCPIREIAADAGVNETAMRMRLVRLRRAIYKTVRDLKLDEL